jgi:hypothetical protein
MVVEDGRSKHAYTQVTCFLCKESMEKGCSNCMSREPFNVPSPGRSNLPCLQNNCATHCQCTTPSLVILVFKICRRKQQIIASRCNYIFISLHKDSSVLKERFGQSFRNVWLKVETANSDKTVNVIFYALRSFFIVAAEFLIYVWSFILFKLLVLSG